MLILAADGTHGLMSRKGSALTVALALLILGAGLGNLSELFKEKARYPWVEAAASISADLGENGRILAIGYHASHHLRPYFPPDRFISASNLAAWEALRFGNNWHRLAARRLVDPTRQTDMIRPCNS